MSETNTANISIVIPNWNGRRWLKSCLDSIQMSSVAPAEVIVVDDGSTDDSLEFVQANYPGVKIIALPDNRGFCRTANAGLVQAKEEAVLLLNNDACLHPDCLSILSCALAEFPSADFFAACMVGTTGEIIESAGAGLHVNGMFYQRRLGEVYAAPVSNAPELLSEPVFGNSGGAGLYRRRLLDDVGLLDEDFVMYHEDQDFNFRAQLRGHRCLYLPQAVVYHLGSASLGKENPRAIELLIRNQLLALGKSLPTGMWLRKCLAILLAEFRSGLFYALQGQAHLFLRALGKVLLAAPSTARKRGAIQANRRISSAELRSLMEQ
jgi:hypothetical protein